MEKLIADHYQDNQRIVQTYENYPKPIQKADFVRYLILHTYGGVYSDHDIQLQANLRSVISEAYASGPNSAANNAIDFLGAHEMTQEAEHLTKITSF